MSDELKPCPFCGSRAATYQYSKDAYYKKGAPDYFRISCSADCDVMPDTPDCRDKEKAIEIWNRRTPEPVTGVVEWTRYTGDPKMLPEGPRHVSS